MAVETLIFVDIDGVLNVGVADPDGSLLGLTRANVEKARKKWQGDTPREEVGAMHGNVDRLMSVYTRSVGGGEDATFAKFVINPATGVSDELLGRLAALIRAAPQATIVLSSAWRKSPARVRRLEAAVSEALDVRFEFDRHTGGKEDSSPAGRLKAIGDFVANHRSRPGSQLRVLVLEDLHATAFGGWSLGEGSLPVSSAQVAEWYLRGRAASPASARVKMVHTFEEWVSASGTPIQVGTGLTLSHFQEALDFLRSPRVDVFGFGHACCVEEVEFEEPIGKWPGVLQMLSCM